MQKESKREKRQKSRFIYGEGRVAVEKKAVIFGNYPFWLLNSSYFQLTTQMISDQHEILAVTSS